MNLRCSNECGHLRGLVQHPQWQIGRQQVVSDGALRRVLHHGEGIVDCSVVGDRFEVHVVTLVARSGRIQQCQCQLDRTLDRAGQQESVEFADARVGERRATLRDQLRAWRKLYF